MQLHQGTWLEPGVITWTLIVHGVPPTNFRSAKMSTFWRDFWQLSTLSTYNSGKDRHIGNLNSKWSTTIPPTLGVKIWWTLVHKQKRYSRTCSPTQLDFFQGDYILALRGVVPSNFHTPNNTLNCISGVNWGAGWPQVGLYPICLVFFTLSPVSKLYACVGVRSYIKESIMSLLQVHAEVRY